MDECKCCQCGNDTFWYLLSGEIRCTKCLKSYPNEFEEQIATLKAEAQELHDKYGKLWDENQRQAEEIAALTKKNKWLKEAKKFILADMEAEKKKWKCYNCGFETSDKTQAEAHFSGEEGEVALCVEWANMDSSERVRAYQELTIELNETREENITLEAKVKEYLTEINNDRYTIESLIIENSTLKQQITALTADLSKSPQERFYCDGCSLPAENKRQAEELKKFQAFWEQSRLTERVSFIRVYSGIKEATDESR